MKEKGWGDSEGIEGAPSVPWTTSSSGDLTPLMSCEAEREDLQLWGAVGSRASCFLVCALDQQEESHPHDQVHRPLNFLLLVRC